MWMVGKVVPEIIHPGRRQKEPACTTCIWVCPCPQGWHPCGAKGKMVPAGTCGRSMSRLWGPIEVRGFLPERPWESIKF